jgi:hypothetical protein
VSTPARAALVLALLPAAAAAAPARHGQVVRVERHRVNDQTEVHLCFQQAGRQDYLTCIGRRPPRPGTRISLVLLSSSMTSTVDVARVIRSEPAPEDTCGSGQMHAVYYDSALNLAGSAQLAIGLTGVDMAAGTKIDMRNEIGPPEVGPGERVIALDADGNDHDLALSMHPCGTSTSTRQERCLRYWQGGGDRWKVIGEDLMVECNQP